MDYLLAVLTHGNQREPLAASLASYMANVTPRPAEAVLFADGKLDAAWDVTTGRAGWGIRWRLENAAAPVGFCRATGELWQEAARSNFEHVFWLEHDFTFNRPVDLNVLVGILDRHPEIAQVALKRQPVSRKEVDAGGYVQLRPDEYLARQTGAYRWLEHGLFWTTNPSVFRASLAASHPWPSAQRECEGKHGICLAQEHGYRFALMGTKKSKPWVTHIGERTGKGY